MTVSRREPAEIGVPAWSYLGVVFVDSHPPGLKHPNLKSKIPNLKYTREGFECLSVIQ